MSSPVRVNPSGTGSPGFRSQKRLSAGTIIKKIETLEGAIESLRQQLVFSRSEEEQISNTISKRKTNTNPKQPKEPKETKAKETKAKETKAKETKPKETKPKEPKEHKASAEEKDKIPMPWTGIADFTSCVGLKAQYGLFIQCGKSCNATSGSFQIDNHECRFCNECTKKCDENGKHPVGTIEERIEAGVGKYVNDKTGKKETAYIEVLEKMGITKEQALESAAKRGLQIPDWMLEKPEKKRGRPGKNTENVASESVVENQGKQEKQEKPKKEPKQKQPPRSKKTASVATFDTPQKVSTTKDSAQSSVCVDLNDTTVVAAVAAAPQEKKKRGRPTKSNTENNVDMSEMQQLIVQATTEKKKRLSLDTEVMPSDESESSLHPETQLFNGQENKSEDVESDEVFEMFDEMIRNEEQEQQVVKEVVKEDVKEPAKKKKGSEEAAAIKEAAKEAAKKKKEEEAAIKEAAKEAAKKKKEEEAAAKEAAKEAAKKAAKKKKDEEAAAKEAAKKKKESEETEETEDENEDEDDEELECEEYEYEGETYGLAPNGDIYSQDGDLVGKLTNGVTKMFD
jgi:hypothetical protein